MNIDDTKSLKYTYTKKIKTIYKYTRKYGNIYNNIQNYLKRHTWDVFAAVSPGRWRRYGAGHVIYKCLGICTRRQNIQHVQKYIKYIKTYKNIEIHKNIKQI